MPHQTLHHTRTNVCRKKSNKIKNIYNLFYNNTTQEFQTLRVEHTKQDFNSTTRIQHPKPPKSCTFIQKKIKMCMLQYNSGSNVIKLLKAHTICVYDCMQLETRIIPKVFANCRNQSFRINYCLLIDIWFDKDFVLTFKKFSFSNI